MQRGRPITTINSKNAHYIQSYFKKLLNNEREIKPFLIHSENYSLALQAFNTFETQANYLKELDTEQACHGYQILARWIDTYITETGFLRCLNAFNQVNYRIARKNNKKLVHMDISWEAHQTLMNLAESLGLTQKAALDKILKRIQQVGF